MTRIDLTITAKAPLAIGQRKPGGSVSEAADYIPGTVIRGAIAGKILQLRGDSALEEGDDFHKLFLADDAVIFQNAYPAIATLGEDSYDTAGEVRVLPATALSSKTNDGFKPKGGVFDSLIDSYCAREQGLFYEPNDLEGDRVEPFKGFYSRKPDGRKDDGPTKFIYRSHSIDKRLLTRVGINRQRSTAQDQLLYSIEVMNETLGKQEPKPMIYRSSIWISGQHDIPDDSRKSLSGHLQTFFEHHGDRFRLGGSASRGLGKVRLSAEIVEAGDIDVKARVEPLNQTLEERWEQWRIFGAGKSYPSDRTFFSIDLQADAILTEQWRRTMVISATMLRDRLIDLEPDLQLTADQLSLEMAYSSYDYRSGWNAAWGLPKDVELATNIGSVFLFSLKAEPGERLYSALAKLEKQGIGDRCSEGFGQVRVCDAFHQIFRENPV